MKKSKSIFYGMLTSGLLGLGIFSIIFYALLWITKMPRLDVGIIAVIVTILLYGIGFRPGRKDEAELSFKKRVLFFSVVLASLISIPFFLALVKTPKPLGLGLIFSGILLLVVFLINILSFVGEKDKGDIGYSLLCSWVGSVTIVAILVAIVSLVPCLLWGVALVLILLSIGWIFSLMGTSS